MKTLEEVYGTRVISNEEILEHLNMIGWSKVIEEIAETFIEEAYNRVVSPPKTIISFPESNSDFRVMPSFMQKYPHLCGVKIIGACADNPRKHGLPLAVGTYMLNDTRTQVPLLLFDASITTAWRTAAASAVGIRELSDPKASTLGIIGCGVQAHHHIPAISAVRNITNVMAYDIDRSKIDALGQSTSLPLVSATKQEILENAHIVVTMTPTTKAHILTEEIPHRRMMICALGGDSDKKMEFEPSILRITDHFCDSLDQVTHTGTVHNALESGLIDVSDLKALGDLMVGSAVRDSSKPIKMFLSTGVALEDLAIARLLYEHITLKETVWI